MKSFIRIFHCYCFSNLIYYCFHNKKWYIDFHLFVILIECAKMWKIFQSKKINTIAVCSAVCFVVRNQNVSFSQEHMPYFRKRMVCEVYKETILAGNQSRSELLKVYFSYAYGSLRYPHIFPLSLRTLRVNLIVRMKNHPKHLPAKRWHQRKITT